MVEPFVGSEALAAGTLTRYTLRRGFVAIYPDVYLARGIEPTAIAQAKAAWLWSKRRGVVAGRSAAAMLGAKWVDPWAAAEIVHDNRHPPHGVVTWWDHLDDDELVTISSMRLTTPARTALDIACRRPLGRAVAEIDALARASHLKPADVELLAERYRGRRGIRNARTALDLVDAGAESPRETWLRLLLVRAGFPRPQTQIPVHDEFGMLTAVLDMGWPEIKVAADYDGDHHRTSRTRFNRDIRRAEEVARLGWIDIRVTSEDTEAGVIGRVRAARDRRL